MINVKYRLEPYQIYDYQGVERHLADMAAKGWRLESIGLLWKYRRAAPAQVRYAVTYGQDISQFAPAPSEAQESLEELCTSAGWEKTAEWGQMLIFSTENPDPVPLETDGAVLLDVIHRSVKGSFLPAHLLLLVVSLFGIASSVNTLIRTPLRFFNSNVHLFSMSMYTILLVLILSYLGTYFLWRRRSLKSVAQGGGCVPLGSSYHRVGRGAVVLLTLLVLLFVLIELRNSELIYVIVLPLYIAAFFALGLIVRGTNKLMKKRGASKGTNMAVTLIVDCILAFTIVLAMIFGVLHYTRTPGPETYVTPDGVWDLNPIGLPLTASDLTGEAYPHARHTASRGGSIFLPCRQYWDMSFSEKDQEIVDIAVEIWDPKFDWLYDALLEDLFDVPNEQLFSFSYQKEDPAPWGAEQVWRKCTERVEMDVWVLAWPGRVVCFSSTWELDGAQKALIGETFAP